MMRACVLKSKKTFAVISLKIMILIILKKFIIIYLNVMHSFNTISYMYYINANAREQLFGCENNFYFFFSIFESEYFESA